MRISSNQYILYMILAAISILLNLFSQVLVKELLMFLVPVFANSELISGKITIEYWFIISLGFGTVTGFVFKFIVDKFVVFQEKINEYTKDEIKKTTKQLIIYFGFAIFTTIIFWGFEFSFKILLEGNWYLIGGLIGLIIGYTVKFILDRRFVFTTSDK